MSESNLNNQFLKEQLHILKEKQDNEEIEWQDVCDVRTKYTGLTEHRDTVRKGSKIIYEYINAGWIKEPLQDDNSVVDNLNIKQTTTINADKTETSESQFYIEDESKLRDYDYLLRLHNYEPSLFEIVSAKNSKWNAHTKEGSTKTLYSSKITVKPKKLEITFDNLNEWFYKLDRRYSTPKVKITTDYLNGNKMLLLDISDLHMNLQSSMFTTGNEYNCEIAEKLFFYVIYDVLSRTQSYKFNKIIFTIGGDMLNSDNLLGTTTKGTPQSNDVHLFDAYNKLHDMTIKAIDILKDIAPVEVIYIASNHDLTSSWKLSKSIDAWFRNEDRVVVDTSPLPRKYIVFGNTLFVFAHDGNVKELPKLIADEARKYWSNIDFTEVFLQHLHSEQVLLESNNMRIQRLPTISAKSEWCNNSGYNSKRQCKSFIYDLKDGLTDILYTPIKQ